MHDEGLVLQDTQSLEWTGWKHWIPRKSILFQEDHVENE